MSHLRVRNLYKTVMILKIMIVLAKMGPVNQSSERYIY